MHRDSSLMKSEWSEYQLHVMKELERIAANQEKLNDRLSEKFEAVDEKIAESRTEIARVKTEVHIKSSIWGLVGGVLAMFTEFFLTKMHK